MYYFRGEGRVRGTRSYDRYSFSLTRTSHSHLSLSPLTHTSHSHLSLTPLIRTSHSHLSLAPLTRTSHLKKQQALTGLPSGLSLIS